jgi:quercetin dioxygenase-like cupin family protein
MTASCRRTSFALATIILAMGAAAPAQTPAPTGPVVRVSKTFGVSNAPPGPWDVYITLARLPAGFWTGPHTHPGPEFGLIISGQGLRWDSGKQRVVKAGDGYFAPSGQVHEGGAATDGTLQLSVHLIPSGRALQLSVPPGEAPTTAPPPAAVQARLFQSKFAVDPTQTPFTLVEQVVDVPAGASYTTDTAGTGLAIVIAGHLSVTSAHGSSDLQPGGIWQRPKGSSIAVRNRSADPASFVLATIVDGT